MPDDVRLAAEETVPRCPWCSASLPSPDAATCSACGASLHTEGEPQVPGVTAIDPMAVIEGAREPRRPRNRILAWLSGDTEEAAATRADHDALAPPDPAVRREMLRLEMEAELASLSAEAGSIASDQAVEAADAGDEAEARAAVAAVRDTDASTDALVESPEELQVAGAGPAEVGQGAGTPPAPTSPSTGA